MLKEIGQEKYPKMKIRSKPIRIKYHSFRYHINEGSRYISERIDSNRKTEDLFQEITHWNIFQKYQKDYYGLIKLFKREVEKNIYLKMTNK